MPLINLQTNLKSLKYGQDRQGGGDSGLPYIRKDISTANPGIKFDDGLVRGGAVNAAIAGAVDTARIFKFLKDPPKGPLFIVKQVGLQLANPRLEVPKNPANIASGLPDNLLAVGTNGLLQPTRIYNLGINTLAQVPVNAFGIHFNRHGILPIQTNASKYEAVATANNNWRTTLTNIPYNQIGNRLVGLTTKFKLGDRINNRIVSTANALSQTLNILTGGSILPINLTPQQLIIDDYAAGPNSVYGIGRTTLNRYINTEDGFKIDLQTSFSRQFAGKTRNTNNQPITPVYTNDLGKGTKSISTYPNSKDRPEAIDQTAILAYSKSNPSLRRYAQLQEQISKTNKATIYSHTEYIQSPDGNIPNLDSNYKYSENTNFSIISASTDPAYPKSDLETHINDTPQSAVSQLSLTELGFPGTENISDKTAFKYLEFNRTNDILIGDDIMKIVFTPIQPFTGVETPINFLGYLKNYDESYDSTWGDTQYVGRAEKFYIFNSFKRTANISFTVPCFNRPELLNNHKKLFALGQKSLAYALAGQYSENALLGGVIIKATVGNYLVNTPGIITNLKFDIVENSPWDLDAKYAQYLNITVGFTIIGDRLPIYENVKFTVQQTDTEPLPEEEDDNGETPLVGIRTIPQAFVDNTRNTSNQQRYVGQTLRANQQLPNRPRTATGQPIQQQLLPSAGQSAVLSDVLRGR